MNTCKPCKLDFHKGKGACHEGEATCCKVGKVGKKRAYLFLRLALDCYVVACGCDAIRVRVRRLWVLSCACGRLLCA